MEDPRATNSQSENAEMNAFSSQENVSLFQNVHHSSTAFSSSEMKDNDGFTSWEADFQSADSGNQPGVSRSFDAFAGSAVDLSAHMDSVFGSGKDLEDEKAKHASALLESTSGDQIQDDLWNNVNILVLRQTEQVDVTINSKGLLAADNLYSHPSTGTDWLPDDISFSNQTGSVETNIMQSEVSASERLANVKVEVGENVVQAANNGDIFNSATQSEHDVESLLSQMHDLSFRLKSDLSVPSK
ncbi:hypothetical protein RHGRI_017928 [Rhododendron griersonianum]|uniref:Uncharacterized protein n=1 Tax=Rhododendron griersonianum TaxID=479676 RepID=A0AAV6JZL0_9ERIC|nr:hypothetical protein RHGRI_017928 [Rhododendron griersonianum]